MGEIHIFEEGKFHCLLTSEHTDENSSPKS